MQFVETRLRSDSGATLFCIWDLTKRSPTADDSKSLTSQSPSQEDSNRTLAGLIGLINTSHQMLTAEIGPVLILPPYRRTHIASNAVGLLLHYALETSQRDEPRDPDVFTISGGSPLALRRVVWQCNERNAASIRLAQRMGFIPEATQRWGRALPMDRPIAVKLRTDDPAGAQGGINAAVLGICWDNWEGGLCENARRVMQRTL